MGTGCTRLLLAKGVLEASELNWIGVITRLREVHGPWFQVPPHPTLSCRLSYHCCQQPESQGIGTAISSPSLKVYNYTPSKVCLGVLWSPALQQTIWLKATSTPAPSELSLPEVRTSHKQALSPILCKNKQRSCENSLPRNPPFSLTRGSKEFSFAQAFNLRADKYKRLNRIYLLFPNDL